MGSVLPLEEDGDDAEAADAAGEEAEEDVGRGDEPEGEQVDHGVAVVLGARQLGVRPVDPDNSGQWGASDWRNPEDVTCLTRMHNKVS